jgi:hypothetical protein
MCRLSIRKQNMLDLLSDLENSIPSEIPVTVCLEEIGVNINIQGQDMEVMAYVGDYETEVPSSEVINDDMRHIFHQLQECVEDLPYSADIADTLSGVVQIAVSYLNPQASALDVLRLTDALSQVIDTDEAPSPADLHAAENQLPPK